MPRSKLTRSKLTFYFCAGMPHSKLTFCAEMPRSKLMHCFKSRVMFFLFNTISQWTSHLGRQQNMEFRLYSMARVYNYVLHL
jgi:hypothetical protein